MSAPLITVCIPAYNRPEFLGPLLDSVLTQDFRDFNVLVCEDHSPKRTEIAAIVRTYQSKYPTQITYHENEENLGYDANIRNLVSRATGEYCLFMGNDDILCKDALQLIGNALRKYPNVGVVLRSYATFDTSPNEIVQTFRYFEKESFFPAGTETIATFYRRCVVIPGVTIHRATAEKFATSQFDGYLLYQLHLVSHVLAERNGVFLPEIVTLYRNGGIPYFGNSKAERGKFVPTAHTPESSLHFIRGLIEIARAAESDIKFPILAPIFRDLGNYSYPFLSIQAKKPKLVFIQYGTSLAKLGFWRNPLFWAYFGALLFIAPTNLERFFGWIKSKLGHTPSLGKVYKGTAA